MCPEALAAVDEEFCLCGDGHEEYWSGEDETVGGEHSFDDDLVVVVYFAGAGFVAGVAFEAGGDFVIDEPEVLCCRAGGLCSIEGAFEEQVGVALFSGTG